MFINHVLWAILSSLLKWYYLILTTYQRSSCVSWDFFGWKLQRPNSKWLNQTGNWVFHRSGKMGTNSLRQSCVQELRLGQESTLSVCLPLSLPHWTLVSERAPLSLCEWSASRGSRRRSGNHSIQSSSLALSHLVTLEGREICQRANVSPMSA